MIIKTMQPNDRENWDHYIEHSRWGNFFQISEWKSIFETHFGHETHYLFAERGDQITGVLPLLRVKVPFLGNYITSMPGGLCADDHESASALAHKAAEIAVENQSQYIVIRDSLQEWQLEDYLVDTEHCTMLVELSPDVEAMRKKLGRHERRVVRDAKKKNINVSSAVKYLTQFYPVYLEAMRERGTPPLGKAFFQYAMSDFSECFSLQSVVHQEQVIAGGLIAHVGETVFCTWAAIPRRNYHLRPSQVLFWDIIKNSGLKGYRWVDLGRSKIDSGSYHFKLKFGAQPKQLYQYYYLNKSNRTPQVGADRDGALYRLAMNVWMHLPYWMTQIMGRQIRKRIPFG